MISGVISFHNEKYSKKVFTTQNKNINLKKIELEIFLNKSFKKHKILKKNNKYLNSITDFQNSFNTMNILNEIKKSNLTKKLVSIKKK